MSGSPGISTRRVERARERKGLHVVSDVPSEARPAAEIGTRLRVLQAAARLFRTRGYAATSLRDIASAAGLKAGSLYNHFASKEEIVTEILNIGVQTAFDRVKAAVERFSDDTPCPVVLRAAIAAHLTSLLGDDKFTSANIRIFAHVPPHVRDATLTLRHTYERYWFDLLKRCQGQEALTPGLDPKLVSMYLFGAMNWSLEWYRPGRHSIDELADDLVRVFLGGEAVAEAARSRRGRRSAGY
jgi:AcrR family transcriptional regulator